MSFHLRPVDTTHSTPSPTASTASPRDDLRAPHMKPPSLPSPPSSSSGPQPRPFSPGALRDVDLGYDGASAESSRRHYPPPPTGHDLMAMFPAKRPECKPPAASSDIFARQERAFFAQAGREIRRLDAPEAAAPRGWPGHNQPLQPAPHPMTPVQNGGGSYPYPPPGARPVPHMPPPPGPPMHTQPYPPPMPQEPVPHPHAHPSHHRHPSSGPMPMRSPPREPPAPAPVQHADIVLEDPDESWRRPVPCSERRRAGKHTKRVVVKH